MMNGMGSTMGAMMAWMMGLGILLWLLVLVVLVLLAVWLFQQVPRGAADPTRSTPPGHGSGAS